MASYLYRTGRMLQFPRYVPTLIARAQASQNNPTTSGKGANPSVLPKSTTSTDDTNPTKTSSDGQALGHENVDIKNKQRQSSSSSSRDSNQQQQQSFFNSPIGRYGTVILLTLTIYASYKMISGGSIGGTKDLKQNEHYKRATADYQAANTQGTDVKK